MRSEELSQSACLFLLQETWLVQSQGHGLTARSRACKKCERRSASQKNEKNVRLQKSTAWEKPRSRASLRDQTYDFPENRKAIEWIAADTERAFVPWNGYTAQPAFLRLFCIGRRDGDEEKAPFLQGREVHMMNRKHYLHILGTAVVATLCSITNNFSGGGRCSRGVVCFRCSGIWTGRNHCRSETPWLGIQTLSRYRHGHSSWRI